MGSPIPDTCLNYQRKPLTPKGTDGAGYCESFAQIPEGVKHGCLGCYNWENNKEGWVHDEQRLRDFPDKKGLIKLTT